MQRCQKLTKWVRVIRNNSLNQDEVIDKRGLLQLEKLITEEKKVIDKMVASPVLLETLI